MERQPQTPLAIRGFWAVTGESPRGEMLDPVCLR